MAGKISKLALSALVMAVSVFGVLLGFGATGASAQTAGGNATLRVIHASPDAPAVDVYVNGSKAISGLAFGKVSDTATLPAGSYDVKVTAAGATDSVISAKLDLAAGKHYTVVAEGKLANITPKVIEDTLTTAEGKASLRVVHASPDAPAVDVAAKGGAVLVSNLAFPDATGYLSVDPMTVDVEIRPAGTTTVALSVPGLKLEAGNVYTVYAIGLLNGTPALTVLPVVDKAVPAASTGDSNGSTTGSTASGGEMSGTTAAPGMPATGAGDNLFTLLVLSMALVAVAATATGVLVRVRNR